MDRWRRKESLQGLAWATLVWMVALLWVVVLL